MATAKKSDPNTQMMLRTLCVRHMGIHTDIKEAVSWYRKAALVDTRMAQFSLGECYKKGIGSPRNQEEAIHGYKRATDKGLSFA